MRNFNISHPAADALDWDEAMRVITALANDGLYRESMLLSVGCYMGLRISDILRLKWQDILDNDILVIQEKKTKKKRKLKINPQLKKHAQYCYDETGQEDKDAYMFTSWQYYGTRPITRVRADQLLKGIKTRYHITSARVFSTHSLRKTFGRRVWLNECEKGRGEQALVLLCDVFGHSNVSITKRYLGIREEEILSVYDIL